MVKSSTHEKAALAAMYFARLDIDAARARGVVLDRSPRFLVAAGRIKAAAKITGETFAQVCKRLQLRPHDLRGLASVMPKPCPPRPARPKRIKTPEEKHINIALALVRGAADSDKKLYANAAGHLLSVYQGSGESFARLVERLPFNIGQKRRLLAIVPTLHRHSRKRTRMQDRAAVDDKDFIR